MTLREGRGDPFLVPGIVSCPVSRANLSYSLHHKICTGLNFLYSSTKYSNKQFLLMSKLQFISVLFLLAVTYQTLISSGDSNGSSWKTGVQFERATGMLLYAITPRPALRHILQCTELVPGAS
jgi:hypothetical protein